MSMWQRERPVIDGGQHLKPTFTPNSDCRPRDLPPSPRQAGNWDQGNWPYTSYLEFAALPTAPSCARLHTKVRLAEWGLSDLSDDAELVASELATNAMFASPAVGESPALIRLWLLGDAWQLVIVVWDGSRQPPVLTCAPVLAEHGRGLWLVSELSSDWGWYARPDIGGKCAWAQFHKPPAGTPVMTRGRLSMEQVIAVIGPPGVGKTTLTTRLGENPGCAVFRLREHVAPEILTAAAANPDRVDWIDDVNVARALRAHIERVNAAEAAHTVLLDNFPGSGSQVRLLLGILGRLSPQCAVWAAELVLNERARRDRVRSRRVCHTCEDDPAHDPRLPATASESDPRKCARCGGTLHPRRGDAPRLLTARTARFKHEAPGLRQAFAEAGSVGRVGLDHAQRPHLRDPPHQVRPLSGLPILV